MLLTVRASYDRCVDAQKRASLGDRSRHQRGRDTAHRSACTASGDT
jgi:hypothetical protein